MMSLAMHRAAAVAILATGVLILVAWGRSQADETPEIRDVRGRFEGRWVATRVQAGPNRLEGPAAEGCRVDFGRKSVDFRGMVGGLEGRGTYLVRPKGQGGQIDLKLDAGWSIGIFELDRDRLTLALNALALPERLGEPTRHRPAHFRASDGQFLYEFRRAAPGE